MLESVVSRTNVAVDLKPGQKALFISDVHLGYGTRQEDRRREQSLLNVLQGALPTCGHLFIVGDLFDLWFDYDRVIPRDHVRTLTCLLSYREAGIPVTYLMGNHDFGHHTYFKDELDIDVISGDVDTVIAGTRFYIAHGDGKAYNDTGYLILRGILRSRAAQWLYRMLHPNLGIGIASATSHGSRDFTGTKDYGTTDGLLDFAKVRIDEGADVVVMGHRHQAQTVTIGRGMYVNLGHWLSAPMTYGTFDPLDGFTLHTVEHT